MLNAVHLGPYRLPVRTYSLAAAANLPIMTTPRIRPPLVRGGDRRARGRPDSRALYRRGSGPNSKATSASGWREKRLNGGWKPGRSVKRGQLPLRLDPAGSSLAGAVPTAGRRCQRARFQKRRPIDLAPLSRPGGERRHFCRGIPTRLTRQQRRRELTSARPMLANVAPNATGYAGLLADADGVVVETLAGAGR